MGAASDVTLRMILTGDDRSASKALKGVGSEAGKTGGKMSKFSGVGKAAMLGVAGALVGAGIAAVGFAKEAVDAASRAEQSIGGVKAVFGKNAKEIEDAAAGAAKNLGLSKNSYRELATTLGAGLKNKGIKDYADQTKNLIGVGADLAAQFGGSTTDAVDALASAMRGESDPIEKYGVSLSESAVNAELASRGQSKLKGKALETAKAQARLTLITKQTSDAHGAFGRESDTLAGKQARMSARWEDMQAVIGGKLMPVMEGLTDAGAGVMDWLAANPAVAEGASAAFDLVSSALGGLWDIIKAYVLPGLAFLVRGFAQAVGGVQTMLYALGTLPGFEWATTAADKLGVMKDGINAVADGMDALSKDKPEPRLSLKDEAAPKIKKINDQIKGLKDKMVTAKAKGDTKEVERLRDKINALRGKKVDINAHVNKTGVSTIKLKDIGAGGLKISAYRSGGRPPVGQIAQFHKDEFWVPDAAGTVISQNRSRSLMGAGPGSMGSAGMGGAVHHWHHILIDGNVDDLTTGQKVIKAVNAASLGAGGKGVTIREGWRK